MVRALIGVAIGGLIVALFPIPGWLIAAVAAGYLWWAFSDPAKRWDV